MLGTITLTVGQTDAMPQKEDSPETIEVLQDEVSPQVNGDQEEDKSVSVDKITPVEEKVEEKPTESNEVGFKKIFRFVGLKFTLKKDKNEKTEPVQLLTVKETEDGASEAAAEEGKKEDETADVKPQDEKAPDGPETEKEATTDDAAQAEAAAEPPASDVKAEAIDQSEQQQAEEVVRSPEKETSEEVVTATEKESDEEAVTPEKEKESEVQAESPISPPSQETQSPFKRFFTQGIFSNLRKKTSFKKSKDEEAVKEKPVEEDIKEAEEKAEEAVAEEKEVKEDAEEGSKSEQVEESDPKEETKVEATPEELPPITEEQKEEELKVQTETTNETEPVPESEPVTQTITCEVTETPVADEAKPTDDTKSADDKPDGSTEEQQSHEAEVTTEPEVVSSQDKSKAHGSPLKKLFTGAGLKKLSSKKQKSKKEADSKLTESGEHVAEQIQSSTDSAEPQKTDSGPSSPEESGEHVVGEVSQAEANVDGESEVVTSDSEKKKDGILPWSSFKKLVTPKKRVKRPSESEDEASGDKLKSATLSSTESGPTEDKPEEAKPSDEVKDESKEEESQVELKTETKAEKLEQSTEEPKKKMDTSVSWEALICVGSAKKRARKTSDSDDDETKIEEEVQQSGEEQVKSAQPPLESSQEADCENLASSPEPEGEPVSTWESFKRLVTHRKKPKADEKSDEASGPELTASDSEAPKEESSFSFKKLIPRRKKKSDTKQEPTSDVGSAEEDSDTPAVVPLSEYDNEQSEKVETENKEEPSAEEAEVTSAKSSAEDRSPSWISAAVENAENDPDGKQLSDIPEEGDTAATPKSTDNTVAEDIVEFTSEAVTALEPAEETEMVSAVSRITASPVTSGETTPVPGDGMVNQTETILQEAVETISVTSSAVAATITKEQENMTAAVPVHDKPAIKEEKVVLVSHDKSETMAVCTDLDTNEIKDVEEESPLKASVESVTTVTKVLSVEVAVEDQTPKPVKAGVDEQKIFEAQINEVQADYKVQLQTPIENAVDETAQLEAVNETPMAETVNELQQATAVKAAVVTAVQQEAQTLEEPLVAENSPKVEAEGPIEPSVEESVYAQTVEITEMAVAQGEKVQELKDINKSVASFEVASVEGVDMAVSEEVTPLLADAPIAELTESKEDSFCVVAQTEESAVTEEIICDSQAPVSTQTESVVKEKIVIKEVPIIERPGDHRIEVVVKDIEMASAKVEVEETIGVASSKVGAVVEDVCKKVLEEVELSQAMDVKEAEAIQEQSTIIVQEVIQNVVENLSEISMAKETTEKPVEEKESSTTITEESIKSEDVPSVSEIFVEKPAISVSAVEETPSADVIAQAEKPAAEEPAHYEKSAAEEPVHDEKPAAEEPVHDENPAAEEPVHDEKPAAEEPVHDEKPAAEEPIHDEKPAAEEPVHDEKPAAEEPVHDEKPAAEEPLHDEKPAAEEPVKQENPAIEEPIEQEKTVVEEPVQEEKPAVEIPVQEEKPPAEPISENLPISDTKKSADEVQTRIVNEPSLIEVNEAIQISENVPVAITDKIEPEKEEVATVTMDAVQQFTEIIKQEVELKEAEKCVEDKPVGESKGSEEGGCQVEDDHKEELVEIQQATTKRPVSEIPEESSQITQISTLVSTKQAQVVEEQCQIETAMEINVGIINVVDADRKSETTITEAISENQEQVEEKSKEGSEGATCQKTEAKAIEVKTAVEETVNAIEEEAVTMEVENEIEPVSTEVATVS